MIEFGMDFEGGEENIAEVFSCPCTLPCYSCHLPSESGNSIRQLGMHSLYVDCSLIYPSVNHSKTSIKCVSKPIFPLLSSTKAIVVAFYSLCSLPWMSKKIATDR